MGHIIAAIAGGLGTGILFMIMITVNRKTGRDPQVYTFLWAAVASITFLPAIILYPLMFESTSLYLNAKGVIYLLLAGICFVKLNNNMHKAQNVNKVDLPSFTVIYRSSMIMLVVIGIICFGERLTLLKSIGIISITAAVLCVFFDREKLFTSGEGGKNTLKAAFYFAIAMAFTRMALDSGINPLVVGFANYFVQVPSTYKKEYLKEVKKILKVCKKEVILAAILVFPSWLALLFAMMGQISVVQPIFQAVQLTVAVLGGIAIERKLKQSTVVWKETENENNLNDEKQENIRKIAMGFMLALIGVILLSLNK